MYDIRPNLIIGFHGCELDVRDALLNNPDSVKISTEPYDWLGHGMYFWENNYDRALQWAEDKKKRGRLKKPSVIGALLNLGYCCDLLDSGYVQTLKSYYILLDALHKSVGKPLPRNKDLPNDRHKDKILREFDCAAIEYMHSEILKEVKTDIQAKGYSDYKVFDSTRGVFIEGGPIFEGAGIFEKSHIQICIRNLNCIKGFFLPRKEINFLQWIEGVSN
jgi:hypothetical protein